jgi:tetratricopeptide (TPR) repeat protein
MASAGVVGTALCMADGGSITEAKSMLEKLVSDVDSPVEVYTALAVILQENGEDAVPIVHQGIAKYRYNGALENLLGVCLENKGDFAGAEEAYSAATKLLPRSAIVHVNLGDTFREQVQKGSAGSALKEYMIALGIDPTSVDAHIGMGIVYRSDGKIELAEDHYRKALSIDHNSQYAWRYLADLHQDQGRYAEAKDEYANAVKDGGENDPVILENYARCYQGLKDYKQADLLYGRAVARYQKRIGISQRLAPEYVQALFRWRDLLVQMGEDTTASEKGKMAEAIKLQYHLN